MLLEYHEMPKRAYAHWKRDGLAKVARMGVRYLRDNTLENLRYWLWTRGPLADYAFEVSKRRLKEAMRMEDGLYGIVATAYGFSGVGVHSSIAPHQEADEFVELAEKIARRDPDTVVEIGTSRGGTLYVLSRYLDVDTIVSVDLHPYYLDRAKLFVEFVGDADFHALHRNSHDPETEAAVRERVGEEGVDFLFIDGDHTYEGVKTDFELYAPLVSSGGIIAFHDIIDQPWTLDSDVSKFWSEIKSEYESEEIVRPAGKDRGGIGLLYV